MKCFTTIHPDTPPKRRWRGHHGGLGYQHLATTYYRPSWQGGDVEQPLCGAIATLGVCEARVANYPMARDIAKVDCPRCLRAFAIGPSRARRERITAIIRNGHRTKETRHDG